MRPRPRLDVFAQDVDAVLEVRGIRGQVRPKLVAQRLEPDLGIDLHQSNGADVGQGVADEQRVLGQHDAKNHRRRNAAVVRLTHGVERDRIGAFLRHTTRAHEIRSEGGAVHGELRRRHQRGEAPRIRRRSGRRQQRLRERHAFGETLRDARLAGKNGPRVIDGEDNCGNEHEDHSDVAKQRENAPLPGGVLVATSSGRRVVTPICSLAPLVPLSERGR